MNDARGFTLIEVLVAGILIAVVLLGVATMALTASGQLARGGEQTHAVQLGQQRVEWLRNQNYASLGSGTTTELLTAPYEGYARTTKIDNDTPRVGVKQVSVTTVTPSGMTHALVALIAEP